MSILAICILPLETPLQLVRVSRVYVSCSVSFLLFFCILKTFGLLLRGFHKIPICGDPTVLSPSCSTLHSIPYRRPDRGLRGSVSPVYTTPPVAPMYRVVCYVSSSGLLLRGFPQYSYAGPPQYCPHHALLSTPSPIADLPEG